MRTHKVFQSFALFIVFTLLLSSISLPSSATTLTDEPPTVSGNNLDSLPSATEDPSVDDVATIDETATPETEDETIAPETTTLEAKEESIAPGVWSDADPYFTNETPAIAESTSTMRRAAARITNCPTYQEAYEKLVSLQTTFPEGMTYTNFVPYGENGEWGKYYVFQGGAIKGANKGVGCAAYAFESQDNVFPGLPARVIDQGDFEYEDLKVGDILRTFGHFTVILKISPSAIVVTEANYNSSVHHGRTISRAEVMAETLFVVTRYPAGYSEDENKDDIAETGADGDISWTLTNGGVLTLSGSGTIPNNGSWNTYNDKINTISISEGVTSIGDSAFANSKAMTVYLPSSLTKIGNNAFQNASLTAISIPSNVASIGREAFSSCKHLVSIDLADGVSTIGDYAFEGCESLLAIDLPSSLTSIGAGAFSSCQKLMNVRFMPSSGKLTIGDGLFINCWYLQYVSLPEGITSLPKSLFQSCKVVQYIYIPKSITELPGTGEEIFVSSNGVNTIFFGGTETQWKSLLSNIYTVTVAMNPYSNYSMLSSANTYYDMVDPFVPQPDDPGDIQFPCENGHIGERDENGNCTVCGDPMAEGTEPSPSPSPSPEPTAHQHDWSDDWTFDEAHHWHECLADDCDVTVNDQKSSYAEHNYGDWITDSAATTTETGSRYHDCKTCGYRQTESIPVIDDSGEPEEPSETEQPSASPSPSPEPSETPSTTESPSSSPATSEKPAETDTPPQETNNPPTESSKPDVADTPSESTSASTTAAQPTAEPTAQPTPVPSPEATLAPTTAPVSSTSNSPEPESTVSETPTESETPTVSEAPTESSSDADPLIGGDPSTTDPTDSVKSDNHIDPFVVVGVLLSLSIIVGLSCYFLFTTSSGLRLRIWFQRHFSHDFDDDDDQI